MQGRTVRLLIAGGGTGGHVLPAMAVLQELQRREIPLETLWIGSKDGVEREHASTAGIPYRVIATGKLRRYLSIHTVLDAVRMPIGTVQAWRHVRIFRPDVVFSTGGFVSVPAVVAARRYPLLTHEQTATIGLANRLNARFADVLAVSYDQTISAASAIHRHAVVTGNPIRASLANGDAARGRRTFGFTSDLPVLYVTGGARGASPLNQRIAALLPDLLHHCQVLHQTGPAAANSDAADLARVRESWPSNLQQRYQVREFIGDELADVYAAADLILARAGAGTVAEIARFGPPAILIPLPGTSGDEQTRNARILSDAGAAILLPQAEVTPESLRKTLLELLQDPDRRAMMTQAARTVGNTDAAANIADLLLKLAGYSQSAD